jgi:hypothetical protein
MLPPITDRTVITTRIVEADCARCDRTLWPAGPVPEGWICHRCRAVLAGRNAVDPLVIVTPERLERLARARQASRALIRQGKAGLGGSR